MGQTGQPDPHAPLRDDVRLLGEMLGDIIREQDGPTVFGRVEQIRRLAKAARAAGGDRAELVAILSSLPDAELVPIARAFSQFLNLANIAEQHHRVRRRRCYRRQSEYHPQPGSLDELLPRLSGSGISRDRIESTLLGTHIELVLTAHPTEVNRRTLIRKYDAVADSLTHLDHDDLTPDERQEEIERLRRAITAIWNTDEIRHRRPTPVDEAKWGIALVERVLWQAVPRFLRELNTACRTHVGRELPIDHAPIRFASWMGGDRDGNPGVTAAVTEEALLLARWSAASLYLADVRCLRAELSMNACNQELRALVRDAREPYRALLNGVASRLAATMMWVEERLAGGNPPIDGIYLETDQLREPLLICYRSLVDCHMTAIANGPLLDTLRRIACFGISLLTLDVRQSAQLHSQALDEWTQARGFGSYHSWTEEKKQLLLFAQLREERSDADVSFARSPEAREVMATFAMLARQSPSSLGAYIVSMTSTASDILAVMVLQRTVGIKNPLRVVPLFETERDLDHAVHVIADLLSSEWYRSVTNNTIEVMIGYSDSAKEAGFLAASWAQYRAQEKIAAVCREYGTHLTFFHGRGGSVSRGGAPSHAAILSQPPGTISGSIRITEQGEAIRYKFGLGGIAVRTLEVYASAMIEAQLLPPKSPPEKWRITMDHLSAVSSRHYRHIVNENPDFPAYFHSTTPISELQHLPVGSRPSRRYSGEDFENLRAIPWVFAWTQVRLMLPVWLGVGKALDDALQNGHAEIIKEMTAQWPYFRAILDMLEMVLAKAEPNIAEFYEQRLTVPALHPLGRQLRHELQQATLTLQRITGHGELLETYPVIRRSINVRNPYTDPLNLLQAEIMQRYRHTSTESNAILIHALIVTITGIAAGMRNAG